MINLEERGLLWSSYTILAGSSHGFYIEDEERRGEVGRVGKEAETETDK